MYLVFYGAEIQHGIFFGGGEGWLMCIQGIKNSPLRGHELPGDEWSVLQ